MSSLKKLVAVWLLAGKKIVDKDSKSLETPRVIKGIYDGFSKEYNEFFETLLKKDYFLDPSLPSIRSIEEDSSWEEGYCALCRMPILLKIGGSSCSCLCGEFFLSPNLDLPNPAITDEKCRLKKIVDKLLESLEEI